MICQGKALYRKPEHISISGIAQILIEMNNSSYLDPNESLLNASGLLDQPQPSLATGNFKSSGWDPFGANGDASVIGSTAIRRSSDLKKKKEETKRTKP